MTFEEILRQFKVKSRSENTAQCICPAHDDHEPSLSISKVQGRILIHCHCGCKTESVLQAVGLKWKDLFADQDQDEETKLMESINWFAKTNNLRFVAKYSYCYGQYKDGLTKVKFLKPDNRKDFRWIHRDSDSKSGYRWNHKNCSNRLYVCGNLDKAARVFLTEGEKDSDSTYSITGITCVSAENGASKKETRGKWRPVYTEQLKGKEVYVLQDNDEVGRYFARIEAENLYGKAEKVFLVDLVPAWPECPEHGDISDMIASLGVTEAKARLTKLIESVEEFRPATSPDTEDEENSIPVIDTNNVVDDLDRFHLHDRNGNPSGAFDYEIHKYLKEVNHIFVLGKVPYIYKDGVYRADLSGAVLKTLIRSLIYPQFVRSTTIKRIYDLFIDDADLQTTFDQLNQYPAEWICFHNGFYDPVHCCMVDHNPEYRAINQIPFDYDPTAAPEGEKVKAWLEYICPDPDDREMICQYAGYCLTRDTRQQKFMVLRGEGGTGKSTLISLIMHVIGTENITNISLAQLTQRFSAFSLMGKLLNSCADLEVTALEDVSTIKKIIGEDPIAAEAKGKDPVSFKSYAKLIFSTNELPLVKSERTSGFYRRLLILKMDRPPETKSSNFFQELTSETEYFIHVCVDAVSRMYQNGFILESESSKAEVQQLRCDSDTVEAFLTEKTRITKNGIVPRSKLYAAYTDYCQDMERQSLRKTAFFKALRAKGFSERKANVGLSRGVESFCGISFIENAAENAAEDLQEDDDIENPFLIDGF